MSDAATLSIDGPIATITLNRPEAFNSVNLAIAQKLEQLGAEVEANDAVKVLVIQGEGRAFSAGGDLQTIGAAAEADTIAPVVGELLKHYHAFIETVRRMPKIVLSSVHGSAAGAGMGLAFVTDLCIATDDARFTPAYAKIGVSPDGGSTVGMVGTVGVRRAFQIFLAEDSFSARQAHDWGLVAKVVPDARKYFDGEGAAARAEAAGNFFAMVPMDRGGRVGWCRCEECQKQIDQERLNENLFDSNGSGSDYWFGFVNQVAREIAKSHPEKTISTLAYAGYSYRPRKVVLEPNVSVQMCLHTRNCWVPGMTADEERWSEEWVREEKGRKFYLWLYHCLPELQNDGGPPFRCFPGFHAHRIDSQFKRFARMGIRGAFIEGVSDQVDAYVTMKLLDDPAQDVEGMLEEFFSRYYGGAAKPMKEFYTLMEEIYCDPGNYPEEVRRDLKRDFFQTEEIAWRYLGTEERMARLGALMDEATGLASNEVERQRVLVFRQGVWDHMEGARAATLMGGE